MIVNNLAPAMLRGEASNGMLLAATSGEKVVLLTPDDPECVAGAKITWIDLAQTDYDSHLQKGYRQWHA